MQYVIGIPLLCVLASWAFYGRKKDKALTGDPGVGPYPPKERPNIPYPYPRPVFHAPYLIAPSPVDGVLYITLKGADGSSWSYHAGQGWVKNS